MCSALIVTGILTAASASSTVTSSFVSLTLITFAFAAYCVPVSDSKLFERRLDAKVIIKSNEEHFNETKEIKEILEFIEDGD